jgi:hypothetical protein
MQLARLRKNEALGKVAVKNLFRIITYSVTGLSATPFAEATCDAKNHKGGGRILLLEIARRALYIASMNVLNG